MMFNTHIHTTGRIIAFSDIHGDINSLIIILRDCAKVIKKKENYMFNQNELDQDMEKILNTNINNTYIDDLNYEWIGENTYIVICGDIIDPHRFGVGCKKNKEIFCHYYPQIELKILRFINAINKLAMKNGGRIIKLLGNHEWENIKGRFDDYIFPMDEHMGDNYYIDDNNNKFKRLTIFNYDKYGFKLLFEDGCYVLIIINNIIFVHGGIANKSNYEEINQTNIEMNNKENWQNEEGKINQIMIDKWNKKIRKYLWDRDFGLSSIPTDCILLHERLNNFVQDLNITNPILVIGHCIQVNLKFPTYTLTKEVTKDNTSITFGIADNIGNPMKSKSDNKTLNTTFGITSDCFKNDMFNLYRTDVGTSRAFDVGLSDIDGRTPQCLEIINNKFRIIKSYISNTTIHLPRYNENDNNKKYFQKYFKYKYKYMLYNKKLKNFKYNI
jgi:hypothetical protein